MVADRASVYRCCYPAAMLTRYLAAALSHARYEVLPEGEYYGEIPGLDGVCAASETLEECRNELADVLEGWILLGLQLGHALPEVDGISLSFRPVA